MDHLLKPGSHSEHLWALFGSNTTFTGDGPVFDRPLYVLAFTNRSGSNLLAEYLVAHPQLAGFAEVLNKQPLARVAKDTGAQSFPAVIEALVRRGSNGAAGQAFGLKAGWDQLNMLLRHRIDRMFRGFRIIHIERQDILAQAISYDIAVQTNHWKSYQSRSTDRVPDYDFAKIGRLMINLRQYNVAIRISAEASGWPVIHVTYEELVADPAGLLRRILGWAGLPDESYALPVARHQKQTLSIGDEIRARYLADYAAAVGFSGAG